jgi:hypothetical protein
VLVAGLGCYAAAFPFAADREDLRTNFSFFTSLALVFLLLGGPILLPRSLFALAAGILGFASCVVGLRLRRTVLIIHAFVFLTVGAIASGFLDQALSAFLGQEVGLTAPTLPAVATLAFLAAAHGFMVMNRPTGPLPWRIRWPSFLIGTQAVLGIGALAIWGCVHLATTGTPDPGLLALFRTGAISTSAIGIALLGRRYPASELRWLVYPLLALAALKFLFEDLAVGRPLTLFPSFMLFGAALILAPRFMRSVQGLEEDGPAPPGAEGG